jgi:hypothetical protein
LLNSLSLSYPVVEFYRSLNPIRRASLDKAFDYIRDVPFEHGDIITRRLLPPVMVYTYNDGVWRCTYSLGLIPETITYTISVYSVKSIA